jgi:Cu(I)/Ag(I) efflux system membrane fusion protein
MSARNLFIPLLAVVLLVACQARNSGGKRHAPSVADSVLDPLLRPTSAYAVGQLTTVTMRHGSEHIQLHFEGLIAWDTREVGSITARVSGRIEKLHIRSMFSEVSKGQAVAEMYSPELATAQENLLFILKQDPGNASLIAAARQKLLLLGMSNAQLERIIRQGVIDPTVTITSPYAGRAMDPGMGGSASSASATGLQPTAALSLKEGDYVAKGATLMSIVDDRKVWALIKVPPSESDALSPGDSIIIVPPTGSGGSVRERIGSIEPFFREGEWNLTARVPFDNSKLRLPVGMPVQVTAVRDVKDADWLPQAAVISTGKNDVVFVADGAGFTSRRVRTGIRTDSLVQVLGGLAPTERVAANGQFLMDSESFIKTAP